MPRITAGDRRCDARLGNAAVDTKTGQRQPPCAKMLLLKLAHELGDQPLERLARRLRMVRRLFQPQRRARRKIGRNSRQRLGFPAQLAIERINHILAVTETSREREPGYLHQRTDGLKS